MQDHWVEGFFYGLYMDEELLRQLGYAPLKSRIASLPDHKIDLRGSIKYSPQPATKVWGMLIKLSTSDLQAMYATEAAKDYLPEEVTVHLQDGQSIAATCYNLPLDLTSDVNHEYTQKLLPMLKKLSLPAAYIQELESLTRED